MVELSFWKMHGIGNDYVLVDNRDGRISEGNLGKTARNLCRRRFSIGADGLLLLYGSSVADVRMRIFNPDGSEAEMCGNGIRCFAKYCYENGVVDNTELRVETLAGVKTTWLKIEDGRVTAIMVYMGQPIFERDQIPVLGKGRFINEELDVDGAGFRATCLSVGNPHCVIFVDDVEHFPVETIGPIIENHRLFPNRINVEFAQVINEREVKMRVWERGAGETMACGTGACATAVAGNVLGKVGQDCIVHLTGGDLNMKYVDDKMLMTGPAETVFRGIINLEFMT